MVFLWAEARETWVTLSFLLADALAITFVLAEAGLLVDFLTVAFALDLVDCELFQIEYPLKEIDSHNYIYLLVRVHDASGVNEENLKEFLKILNVDSHCYE